MSLIDEILRLGVARAAVLDPLTVCFSSEFRTYCEQNKCGHYGKNWMCPPAVGAYEELKERARVFKEGLVFQTVHQFPHSHDPKAFRKPFGKHSEALENIVEHLRERYGVKDMLALGGGPCTYCEECSATRQEPCRYPKRAVASLESYGIDVGALVTSCGMPYVFEEKVITLVGAVFYNQAKHIARRAQRIKSSAQT